jgi:hypothetical protein
VECIGSSQELRLEIFSNWHVDTIPKLLVLGAQALSRGCRKDDARFLLEAFRASGGPCYSVRLASWWSGWTSWCTLRWPRCLRGYFSLRTAGHRSW